MRLGRDERFVAREAGRSERYTVDDPVNTNEFVHVLLDGDRTGSRGERSAGAAPSAGGAVRAPGRPRADVSFGAREGSEAASGSAATASASGVLHDADDLVLVADATACQGQATARELLARGWRVRALVRDPDAPAARALARVGAELHRGDLADRAGLADAVRGAYGVFSVQCYWGRGAGYDGVLRQARNLAEAARAEGVGHFVQSSIADCDAAPDVRHFACKCAIEEAIDALGLPRTFLRSVFLMDAFVHPRTSRLAFPVLAGGLRPQARLHLVSARDVGRFAADAFEKPVTYLNLTVDIAGDVLTVEEMKAAFARATGAPPPRWHVPRWLLRRVSGEMASQLEWTNVHGWRFSLDGVRERRPDVTDFETFLREGRGRPQSTRA